MIIWWKCIFKHILSIYVSTSETDSGENPKSISTEKHDENKNIDEKEVWALRAQALKSLACKRASRVKMAKKVMSQSN